MPPAASEEKSQDPEENQDDPSGHDQRVDGQEDDVEQRLPPGGVERKKEVGHGLPEKDDQEDDAQGRAIKIFRSLLKGYGLHEKQREDQPGRHGPDEHEEGDLPEFWGGDDGKARHRPSLS